MRNIFTLRKHLYIICASCILILLSCGVEEYYYLPQVPEISVSTVLNTSATLNLPPIPNDYYYAGYYIIFYKIYASNHNTQSSSVNEFYQISSNLSSDYNYFSPFANPTNTSSTISINTFKNRNFFELKFEDTDTTDILPKTGGTLNITFSTASGTIPTASLDSGGEKRLLRSSELTSPEPPDRYFRNTTELRDLANANSNKNADVAGQSSDKNFTYAAMYIVAAGTNPASFTPIYSKPTFINVFKLPD